MTASISDEARVPGQARLVLWASMTALMAVPVIVSKTVERSAWEPGHAVFLAILAAVAGIVFEGAARVPGRVALMAGAGLAGVTALLQAWINLAVGVIGSEDDPANLIYAGVIGVAMVSVLASRLRPRGLAWAMVAAAVAQVAAFVVALVAGLGFTGPITVFFTALWLTAAWLFQRAGR